GSSASVGKNERAASTRSRTSCRARRASKPASNSSMTDAWPSLEIDTISFTPSSERSSCSSGLTSSRSASSGLMPSKVTETYIMGMATSGLASFGVATYAAKPAITRHTNISKVARLRSRAARIKVSISALPRVYRIDQVAGFYKSGPQRDDLNFLGQPANPDALGVKAENFHWQKYDFAFVVHRLDTQLALLSQRQQRRRQAMSILIRKLHAEGRA